MVPREKVGCCAQRGNGCWAGVPAKTRHSCWNKDSQHVVWLKEERRVFLPHLAALGWRVVLLHTITQGLGPLFFFF